MAKIQTQMYLIPRHILLISTTAYKLPGDLISLKTPIWQVRSMACRSLVLMLLVFGPCSGRQGHSPHHPECGICLCLTGLLHGPALGITRALVHLSSVGVTRPELLMSSDSILGCFNFCPSWTAVLASTPHSPPCFEFLEQRN